MSTLIPVRDRKTASIVDGSLGARNEFSKRNHLNSLRGGLAIRCAEFTRKVPSAFSEEGRTLESLESVSRSQSGPGVLSYVELKTFLLHREQKRVIVAILKAPKREFSRVRPGK